MRTLGKVLIVSLATVFAAPAFAAPKGGGGGGGGDGGSRGVMSGGGGGCGVIPCSGGGSGAPQTGSRWVGAPPAQTGGFATGSRSANGGNDWRRRRHYWPHAVYGFGYNYGGDGYDDYNELGVDQCVVSRKVYNARGLFVGWRKVNLCAG